MPRRAARPHRPADAPSTRTRIVSCAIAIADAEGLTAVSIRRVAAELGIRPMTLYSHISSKADLLDLMGEAIVGEILLREVLPDDWRQALALIATRAHETFVAHPWVLIVAQQRKTLGRNGLRYAEQQLAALASLSLSAHEAWRVLYLIGDFTLGHALRVAHAPDSPPGSYPAFDPADYPHLARALSEPAPARSDETFRDGLDRILDVIEREHRRLG